MENSKIQIYLVAESLFSNSEKAITFANTKKLGEIKDSKVYYSKYEAMYLIEKKQAELVNKNLKKTSNEESIISLAKKEKDFLIKYLVFKKLREKGYIVKTGLKFGGEFRVYENPKINSSRHAKWIVFPIKQSEKLNLQDFISKNRIAHSTAKNLLLAIVDSENDILFYEISWLKL